MSRRRPPDKDETREEMQRRLVAETSVYLTECLRHPELATRIPIIQAGTGHFPPSLTPAFWNAILYE